MLSSNLFFAMLAVASVSAGRINLSERLASCKNVIKTLGNATIETDGSTAKFSVTYCPAPEAEARGVVELPKRREVPRELDARQTCTQCPCANGSIQCFCHNLQSADSLFIFSCSNSTPVNSNLPVTSDCNALASIIVNGAPGGAAADFPVMTNGFYNVPVDSILTWEFQGCGFGFFNDVGSSYQICAKDLANSVNALAGYCTDVNDIDAQFQNDPFKSLLVFNPAELS